MTSQPDKPYHRLKRCRAVCWTCLALFVAAWSGCSRFYSFPDTSDPAALDLYQKIRQNNDGLKAYKGLGRIKLHAANTTPLQERVAWVGAFPANLRVVVLVSGRPAVKLAADGHFFYVVDLLGLYDRQQAFRKFRVTDPDLARMLSISIKTSELLSLLAGRIPPVSYDAVRFDGGHPDREVLALGRRWTGVIQKIHVERGGGQELIEISHYQGDGRLRYRARFERLQSIGGYRVPARLVITGPGHTRVDLKIDRFWADVEVTPDMFRLEKPAEQTPSR